MGRAGDAPSMEEFGRRVRARRKKLGLSQMALAEVSGLHFTYVSSVERAKRNVTLTSILRICAALELDPGELLRGMRIDSHVRN